MNGKLSVIIPVYNTEPYLEKALRSIVEQTYENLEIIIIDDGSTDHSADIYTGFAAKDNRIVIYKQPNSGVAYSRNTGLALASGDYITFFDSDDWLDKDAYQEILQLLEDTNTDIAMYGYVNEYDDNRYVKSRYDVIETEVKTASELLEDMLLDRNAGFTCNKIFKKDIIQSRNIVFNTQLSLLEDFLFMVKICRSNPLIVCSEKAYYHYYCRYNSLSKTKFNERKFTANAGSELILKDIRLYFPELINPAAEFFYNTNVGLLGEVYCLKPVNTHYLNVIRDSIKNAGLLDCVRKKVRLKVKLILNFPRLFCFLKRFRG
ncbi:MAG TPA: glycosyltransferase family 2 protein [Mobilitalea sp.]|nr:glycosyltransferase family 2 protein [Mobilitalea sp.]